MLEVFDRVKQGGDLSARVALNFDRQDELGRVTDGINSTLSELESFFSSGNAAASQELAEIAARQAASVEEISASLEQIQAMAQESNSSAQESRGLMEGMGKPHRRGGKGYGGAENRHERNRRVRRRDSQYFERHR